MLFRSDVRVYDPEGNANAAARFPRLDYVDSLEAAVDGAELTLLLTEWRQFRALDLKRIKQEMKHPVVVDLRNIYRPDEMAAHGFTYESIGRPR